MMMENSVLERLRQTCGFESVGVAGQAPSDVVLDLNITKNQKGGDGWIRNENQVVIDTLLVLSDGTDGELLGTASIRGKSSGTVINNAPQENEAIDAIAKSIAGLLAKSGCTGPRVAKVEPPPPPDPGTGSGSGTTGTTGTTPPDESKRAEADALNDKGKERLFNADTNGALALFQQANALLPDAKYQFNVCIALGAQEKWDDAIAACNKAKGMNPTPKLAGKIDQRLDGLQHHQ
jgi:tetratricopeptide (TPR) repeat protein